MQENEVLVLYGLLTSYEALRHLGKKLLLFLPRRRWAGAARLQLCLRDRL